MWICMALAVGARADGVGLVDGPPPRPRGAQTIVVTDPATEGTVRLVLPDHAGDTVFVDGWKVGVLPLETVLAEGLHTFRIEGPSGVREIDIVVTPSAARTVELDLSPPASPAAPAQPAAPARSGT